MITWSPKWQRRQLDEGRRWMRLSHLPLVRLEGPSLPTTRAPHPWEAPALKTWGLLTAGDPCLTHRSHPGELLIAPAFTPPCAIPHFGFQTWDILPRRVTLGVDLVRTLSAIPLPS